MSDLADLFPGYAPNGINHQFGPYLRPVSAAADRRCCCCTGSHRRM